MKLAFSTLACPGWTLERAAAAAGQYGYEGLELRLIDGELINARMSASERRRVAGIMRRAGLPIVCVDSSIRVAGPDREAIAADLRAFIEMAHDWESPLVRIFGGQVPAGQSPEQVAAEVAHVLGDVSREAEKLGVAIALETHDAFSSAEAVAAVLRRVPRQSVGALGHPSPLPDG